MTKPTPRRFYVPEGRIVVLPVGLLPGPNATNMRLNPGDTVELEHERIAPHDRYLRGRIRAGDLVELEGGKEPPPAIAPAPTPTVTMAPDPKNTPAVSITPKE